MNYPIETAQLRVGKGYTIQNYRDTYSFTVQEALPAGDFLLVDRETMEKYKLSGIFKFGIGENFFLQEHSVR